jgi:hypothetical protein
MERAQRARDALSKARKQDRLDAAALGELIAVVAELNVISIGIAQRVMNSAGCNNQLRVRCGLLINDAAKTVNKCVENALKLGVKADPVAPPEKPEPVAPDLGE